MLNLTADGNRILSANGPRRQEIYWQMGPFPRESGPGVIGNRPYCDRKVTVRRVTSGKPTARRARWWVRRARSEVGDRGQSGARYLVPRTQYLAPTTLLFSQFSRYPTSAAPHFEQNSASGSGRGP